MRHFLFAALSFKTSVNQGFKGVARAGLEKMGQIVSKQPVRVEKSLICGTNEKCVGVGREDDTVEESQDGNFIETKLEEGLVVRKNVDVY